MSSRAIAVLALLGSLVAVPVDAQPLGTFRWQIQPYCNVFTVTVTQQGGIYTLDGTDDRCGGDNQPGSVVGIAYLAPSGLVGFGLTTVLPNGTPLHTEATINITSLHGTWRDSAGNNGNFIFTAGPGIGGAPRPVPSGGIAAGSVTSVQLAANSVSSSHVVDGSLTLADLAPGTISAGLALNSISGGHVIDASLTAADLATGSVTSAQLAADSVDSAKIANSSVTTADLAAPSVAEFVPSTGSASVALGANTLVRSITITAPAAGRILVSAQGLFDNSAATVDSAACAITTGTTFDVNTTQHAAFMAEQTLDAMDYVPFALNRGFTVSAGANTFNVVCNEYAGNVIVWYAQMTAFFVATP